MLLPAWPRRVNCRLGLAGDSCHRGRPFGPAFLLYATLTATSFPAGKSAAAGLAQKSTCGHLCFAHAC